MKWSMGSGISISLPPPPKSTLLPPPPHPSNDLCGRVTRFWLPESRGRGRSETHRPLSHGPSASRPHHYHLISYNITSSTPPTHLQNSLHQGDGGGAAHTANKPGYSIPPLSLLFGSNPCISAQRLPVITGRPLSRGYCELTKQASLRTTREHREIRMKCRFHSALGQKVLGCLP